jgi:hypothetical protein
MWYALARNRMFLTQVGLTTAQVVRPLHTGLPSNTAGGHIEARYAYTYTNLDTSLCSSNTS